VKHIQHISKALNSHPVRIIEPGGRAQASVALILMEQPAGMSILLIERAANEYDYWSGQIGLPGGKVEPGDNRPKDTAERETMEEIGFDLGTAHYLGRLNDCAPGGLHIIISCFVYAVHQQPILHLDSNEIAEAFWVPVSELNNPDRLSHVDISIRNRLRRFVALRVTEESKQPLWGITYRLLRNLNKIVNTYDQA
jgi:8-oxo-dGTP pyrophosphatase MutT (NUDIX family)